MSARPPPVLLTNLVFSAFYDKWVTCSINSAHIRPGRTPVKYLFLVSTEMGLLAEWSLSLSLSQAVCIYMHTHIHTYIRGSLISSLPNQKKFTYLFVVFKRWNKLEKRYVKCVELQDEYVNLTYKYISWLQIIPFFVEPRTFQHHTLNPPPHTHTYTNTVRECAEREREWESKKKVLNKVVTIWDVVKIIYQFKMVNYLSSFSFFFFLMSIMGQ